MGGWACNILLCISISETPICRYRNIERIFLPLAVSIEFSAGVVGSAFVGYVLFIIAWIHGLLLFNLIQELYVLIMIASIKLVVCIQLFRTFIHLMVFVFISYANLTWNHIILLLLLHLNYYQVILKKYNRI